MQRGNSGAHRWKTSRLVKPWQSIWKAGTEPVHFSHFAVYIRSWLMFLHRCLHIHNIEVKAHRQLERTEFWLRASLEVAREHAVAMKCSLRFNQPGNLLAWLFCVPCMPRMLRFVTAACREHTDSGSLGAMGIKDRWSWRRLIGERMRE